MKASATEQADMGDQPTTPQREVPARSGPAKRRRLPIVLAAIGLTLGAGVYAWEEHLEDHVVPRNLGVVEPGAIFRSGRMPAPLMQRVAEERDVRTIIDLGAYTPGSAEDLAEQQMADSVGITRVRLPGLRGDGTGDPASYADAIAMLADPATHPVLLHCAAGSERTSACVILFRHLVQGVSIADAFPESLDHKHDPGDNWKLLAWLADHTDDVARLLHERGVPLAIEPGPAAEPAP